MSKPDDIPQDVWDVAIGLVMESETDKVPYYEMGDQLSAARNLDTLYIARAIQTAKAEAYEEAANYHDDKAVEHEAFRFDAKGDLIDHHTKMVRFHQNSAAAIRKLGSE